jgi:exopolysaccharide biosynthesis polyprenyl glycosylphosphotransferase
MFRHHSVDFALLSILLDGILVAGNLFLASILRPFLNDLPFVRELFGFQTFPVSLYILLPILWISCLLAFSVYNPGRNLRFPGGIGRLILGSSFAGIALAGVLYLSYRDFSRALFACFLLLMLASTIGWRLVPEIVLRLTGHRILRPHRALIVGAGLVGRDLQQKITDAKDSRVTLVGFLDDDVEKRSTNPLVLGTLDHVRTVIQQQNIDHVILALPRHAHERTNQLLAALHDLPVKVFVVPDYFALTLHHAAIEEFAGFPVLDLRAPALSDYQRLTKRAFDVVLTILILPLALLLMAVIALAIYLDSRGPILFHQERAGENGRIFRMHKFRTMVENAEQLRHQVEHVDKQGRFIHKTSDDPRVTRLGRFLRKFSLDEIPQLFNILQGEMSLVGPRPELPYLVKMYEPWQRKRFAVPPGLTGWWQVHGRSDKPMHLHTEEDLYYIQNYSPWMDILILLKTIGIVFSRRGAF